MTSTGSGRYIRTIIERPATSETCPWRFRRPISSSPPARLPAPCPAVPLPAAPGGRRVIPGVGGVRGVGRRSWAFWALWWVVWGVRGPPWVGRRAGGGGGTLSPPCRGGGRKGRGVDGARPHGGTTTTDRRSGG